MAALLIISPVNLQSLHGHVVRHAVAAAATEPGGPLEGIVDVFGRIDGGRPLPRDKVPALAPYMFHIVIENVRVEAVYSEKLVDAFLTGCVPLLLGASKRAMQEFTQYDVEEGVIFLDGDRNGDGVEDGADVVMQVMELVAAGELSGASYDRRQRAILHNFAVAHGDSRPWDGALMAVMGELATRE